VVTRYYVDTSIAVHALMGTPRAATWFDDVTADEDTVLVSSRLLQTELTRALRRDGLPVADREAVLANVGLVPVTEGILAGAEAITVHVKTLDAVHLASALALGSDVVVVSHDANLKRVAEVLGLSAHDPIDEGSRS
jgi:predicted nucleic acid-binding protein